jgi:hypothetical protein
VLIVEAKKTDLESGVAQALGYMGEYLTMPNILYIRKLTCSEGCIHRERKKLPKRDCTIYGMASNGIWFSFLKISHDSKVRFFYDFFILFYFFFSNHLDLGCERSPKLELPLGMLVYMLRRAAIMYRTKLTSVTELEGGLGKAV